jgi:hypothetical protein
MCSCAWARFSGATNRACPGVRSSERGAGTQFDAAVVARVPGWAHPVRLGAIPVRSRARRAHAVGDPDAMSNTPDTQATDGIPTYLGGGDPAGRFADY